MYTLQKTDTAITVPPSQKANDFKVMSIRRMMWLRFKRKRLALYSGIFLLVMYLGSIFAGFIRKMTGSMRIVTKAIQVNTLA